MSVIVYCLFSLQSLTTAPSCAELGEVVVVQARDAHGEPLRDLVIEATAPDASPLGRTDQHGQLRMVPRATGELLLVAQPAGLPALAVGLRVVAPPRRWLYALLCIPAGLGLLWVHWRRGRQAALGLPPP